LLDLDVASVGRRVGGTFTAGSHPDFLAPRDTDARRSPGLSVSVVIPTKNEARNIGWVLERIGSVVDEIIIVDGLSTDGTADVARSVRPDVTVIECAVPGKGSAIRAGLEAATGDLLVMMDADGSMDPLEISRFLEPLAFGYDLVKWSRFIGDGGTADMTRLRKAGNAGLVRFSNLLLGTSHSELCYGFMAFRRARVTQLGLKATGFEIETELVVKACRAGFAILEIPSFESSRMWGNSNLNTFRDGARVLKTLVRERIATRQAFDISAAAEISAGPTEIR